MAHMPLDVDRKKPSAAALTLQFTNAVIRTLQCAGAHTITILYSFVTFYNKNGNSKC